MNITINTKDGVPIYRQIANQIRYMVASKLLQPGEEITAVRTLALALNVTPNTVVKAYDELESSGVIFKRRGAGTYISDEQSPLAERERRRIIAARIDTLLAEAHQLDFNADDLLDLIKERQLQLGKKKQTQNKESEKIDK
ncbi:GntR family transcriptional regulator [Gammaproteobacteria bacterium]|jgi:GntR family transcriptional regulator|nr:GntR family transcriptional regulator [Gammaproteobacteria bacterium]